MYNLIDSAFTDALKREGKVMNSNSDNTPYNVIFRRNSDTNKLQNTVTIYYGVDCGVHAGQLLKYKGKAYLAINQESAENDVYLKSDLRQTNAIMNYIASGTEYNIPAYAYDVNDALTVSGNVLSVVGGNLELLAENSVITRALKISDCFYALGGYWKIDNLIYKDNVIYIYVERNVTSITYTMDITANDSYEKGTTAQFTATAKADNVTVTNANITWSSSNTSIATVDSNGNATFVATGNVTISALWVEHNVTATKSITVNAPPVYALAINGESTYLTTDTPTLTTTATINGTTDATATVTWVSSDVSKATIDTTGKTAFLSAGDVIITARWTEHNVTATKTISITVPVPTTSYTCKITNTLTPPTEYNDSTNIAAIKIGGSLKPFMCHFYDSKGTEVLTLTPAWSINVSSLTTAQQAKVHLTYQTAYPLRAYVNADSDNSLIGTSFTLTLIDSGGLSTLLTIPVKITSLT